jgi:hypothetical protein
MQASAGGTRRPCDEGHAGPVTGTCTRPCDEVAPLEGPLCGGL